MRASLTLARPASRAAVVAGVVGFAVALALASQVAIPLPGTPVPATLQPFVVVLVNGYTGRMAGTAPYSVWKVLLLLLVALFVIGLVLMSQNAGVGVD